MTLLERARLLRSVGYDVPELRTSQAYRANWILGSARISVPDIIHTCRSVIPRGRSIQWLPGCILMKGMAAVLLIYHLSATVQTAAGRHCSKLDYTSGRCRVLPMGFGLIRVPSCTSWSVLSLHAV